jgi:hypothetical protein
MRSTYILSRQITWGIAIGPGKFLHVNSVVSGINYSVNVRKSTARRVALGMYGTGAVGERERARCAAWWAPCEQEPKKWCARLPQRGV